MPYAEVSRWGYGKPNLAQPARPLLLGSENHGYLRRTALVVGVNGELKGVPDGSDGSEVSAA